jgi:integrase
MNRRGFGCIYQRKKKLPDGTEQTLPTWWIKYRREGHVYLESSRSKTRADAEKLLKKRLGQIADARFHGLDPERIRMSQLFDDLVRDYENNGNKSAKLLRSRLKRHLTPAFGNMRAVDVGTLQVRRYISARRREEAANATINRELAALKRAFNLAAESDPPLVTRVPHIPMLAEDNVRTGFLEHDQFIKLKAALPKYLQPLLVVGYYTGARVQELLNLQWSQVDLNAKRIIVEPGTTKNKLGKTIPIFFDDMERELRDLRAERDAKFPKCAYVFSRASERIKSYKKAWANGCEDAGLAGLHFHDLRRSAVRLMTRAGIPEKIAMQISGHKTRSVFDRYNIVSDRDLSDAADKMQTYVRSLVTLLVTPEQIACSRGGGPK